MQDEGLAALKKTGAVAHMVIARGAARELVTLMPRRVEQLEAELRDQRAKYIALEHERGQIIMQMSEGTDNEVLSPPPPPQEKKKKTRKKKQEKNR